MRNVHFILETGKWEFPNFETLRQSRKVLFSNWELWDTMRANRDVPASTRPVDSFSLLHFQLPLRPPTQISCPLACKS